MSWRQLVDEPPWYEDLGVLDPSSAVHAIGCSPKKCAMTYAVPDASFVCTRCGRTVGWCRTALDNVQICDDCTLPSSDGSPFSGPCSDARLIALHRASFELAFGVIRIEDFSQWVEAETLEIELKRAVLATVWPAR
jgi:hypothetical protein